MKRLMMIAAMMVAVLSANAQNEVGQITLKPMAGVTLATITDSDDSKFRVGLAAGVEGEYGIAEKFGITAGLLYSMQGANYDGDDKLKLGYLNIPILANYYVIPGLAIKAGVQPGFLLSAKDEDGDDEKDGMNSFDLSIPIGASYEYKNFVFDARYNFGLTKINKHGSNSHKNSVFMITVGYKFAL